MSTCASRLRNMLLTQPTRSTILAGRISSPQSARHLSRNYALFKDWKGSAPKDATVKRAEKGEAEDPSSAGAASALKERETNEGIADDTKQQGTTERGGSKHGQKAKKEHPAAPEPVIGMNDERAQVRGAFLWFGSPDC